MTDPSNKISEPPANPNATGKDGAKENIVWHQTTVSDESRASLLGQSGAVVWMTGLSGSGKSTVANELDRMLMDAGRASMLLDGDNVRHGLCAPPDRLRETFGDEFADRFGLGFGEMDRCENIRRVGHVAALMAGSGLIVVTAFVSPYRIDRDRARGIVESWRPKSFFEIFVDTPLEVCERRDPKGLYAKARAGEIPKFTGISDPYEPPREPECHLRGGDDRSPTQQAEEVYATLQRAGIF